MKTSALFLLLAGFCIGPISAQADRMATATTAQARYEALQTEFQEAESQQLAEFMQQVQAEPLMQGGQRYAEILQASEQGTRQPGGVNQAEWTAFQRLFEAYQAGQEVLRQQRLQRIEAEWDLESYVQTREAQP